MSETTPADLTPAEAFFYENSGYGYDPSIETAEQGRVRMARQLAEAETMGKAANLWFTWVGDDLPWNGDEDFEGSMWVCLVSTNGPGDDSRADVIASLYGIGLTDDGDSDSYRRVVEAELAAEALGVLADREENELRLEAREEAMRELKVKLVAARRFGAEDYDYLGDIITLAERPGLIDS